MSTTTDVLVAILSVLLPRLPIVAACLLGCIMAGVQAKRLAGGAVWAVIGFALAAAVAVAGGVTQVLVPVWARDNYESLDRVKTVYGVLGFLWSLLNAVSYGLLIAAVLSGRPRAAAPPMYPPPLPPPPNLS